MKRPEVILLMPISVDGIAVKNTQTDTIYSNYINTLPNQETKVKENAFLMESETYENIGKKLTKSDERLTIIIHPTKIGKKDNLIYIGNTIPVIMIYLHQKGIKKVFVIGSPGLNSDLATKNLIDKLHVVIAPKLLGNGFNMFWGNTFLCTELSFQGNEHLGNNITVLIYNVKR